MSNVEDISRLLRENILPRLDAQEAELRELRCVTWPVCQALWDRTTTPAQIQGYFREYQRCVTRSGDSDAD